jgi:hypothetical protein
LIRSISVFASFRTTFGFRGRDVEVQRVDHRTGSRERDKEIDASGIYRSTSGDESRFVGPRELAQFIAEHHDAHEAFVEQLFHQSNQQPVFAFGSRQLDELTADFAKQNFSIRSAFVNSAVIGAMGAPERSKVKSQP